MHVSDSIEQQSAEDDLIAYAGRALNAALVPHKEKITDKSAINLDGYSQEHSILCEAYAHVGAVKGSQPDKIAADILKMLLVEKHFGSQFRKVLVFADQRAARIVHGGSWLAEACRRFHVEIIVAEIGAERRDAIKKAQERQVMVNRMVNRT